MVKVRLNGVWGRKYKLEASFDLKTWTATGIPFLAQMKKRVEELNVDLAGRYFRITQIPQPVSHLLCNLEPQSPQEVGV